MWLFPGISQSLTGRTEIHTGSIGPCTPPNIALWNIRAETGKSCRKAGDLRSLSCPHPQAWQAVIFEENNSSGQTSAPECFALFVLPPCSFPSFHPDLDDSAGMSVHLGQLLCLGSNNLPTLSTAEHLLSAEHRSVSFPTCYLMMHHNLMS